MAEESGNTNPSIEPVRYGSIPQNGKVYTAEVVNALVRESTKREAANRDAAIRAALDRYTTSIVDQKLKGLEFKLTDDSGVLKRRLNYMGTRVSTEELQHIENPEHGDLYIVNGVGYIYTVEAVMDDGAEEPRYEKYWAPFNNIIDLSKYITRDETWSSERLGDLEKVVDRNNQMVLKIVAQLASLIDKTGLGDSATNAQLAALQRSILSCLQECHKKATEVLDEELGDEN